MSDGDCSSLDLPPAFDFIDSITFVTRHLMGHGLINGQQLVDFSIIPHVIVMISSPITMMNFSSFNW